jgi:hypothetical protein
MKKIVIKMLCMVLVLSTIILSGCGTIRFTVNNSLGSNTKLTGEETINVGMSNEEILYVKNETGKIFINRVDGKDIKVRTVKKVVGKDKNELEEVLNEITASVKTSGDKIEISAVTKSEKRDFWSWKNSRHNSVNVNIEFYVDVPKDLKYYSVENITGDITLSNIKGNVKVENVTGNIKLENTELTGANMLKLTTGNIEINTSLKDVENLDVSVTTGNITMEVPSDNKLSLEAKITTGNIMGNAIGKVMTNNTTFAKDFNGGGAKVDLHVITGNVIIN